MGYVVENPYSDNEQPEFIPLLQETFDVICGDDASWTPLGPGGGTAMPSCIRKILHSFAGSMRKRYCRPTTVISVLSTFELSSTGLVSKFHKFVLPQGQISLFVGHGFCLCPC